MTESGNEKPEKQPLPLESSAAARPANRLRSPSFKYYIHDSIDAYRLQLLGELTEAHISELKGCWRTARTTLGDRKLVLDLRGLKSVDDAGKGWLISMGSEGGSYLPDSFLRNGLVGDAADAALKKSTKRTGLLGKVLSILKGAAAEPTQAQ